MIKIKEAIVVEGRYDIIKLKNIFDTLIIETKGFGIFKDKDKINLLRKIADKRGLVILTDSDGAGFVIRNYLKGMLPKDRVFHAYIPDIYGKEKRKEKAGKEGKLGVEGVAEQYIIDALRNCGVDCLNGEKQQVSAGRSIRKIDMYNLGLYGGQSSEAMRKRLLSRIGLPSYLTVNAMIDALNILYDYNEFIDIAKDCEI